MSEYSPSLNRASTDLEALLPTLVEAYRVQADTSVHEKAEGRFEGFIDQYDVWVDRKLAYEIVQAKWPAL